MYRGIIVLLLLCVGLFLNAQITVTLDSTELVQTDVVTGIEVPWEILWGPDDHIWVTERRGRVLRVDPETGNYNTILNIESLVDSGGEPGLLGMALHPDFENTPLVYLVYTYLPSGAFFPLEKLVTYEWNGTELINENIILDNIEAGNIHNGSRLLMTTDDKILMTTGDTGNSSLSLNMESLSGKVLRINLDGTIPDDNPFPNSYVYTFGHRNAQGLCYGPNGLIYSSEHGAQQSDEVNYIAPSRNYGWPIVQGECNTESELNYCDSTVVIEPIAEYSPCQAVNGLEYYDHPAIPEFQGALVMAVLGGLSGLWERLAVLHLDETGMLVTSEDSYFDNFGRLRDVCINPHNGALYIATNGGSYPGSGPNQIVEFLNENWVLDTTVVDTTVIDTTVMDTTIMDTTIMDTTIMDTTIMDTTIVDTTTSIQFLEPVKQFIDVFPNPVNNRVTFSFSPYFIEETFELISFSGQIVLTDRITSAQMVYEIADIPPGTYYIKASSDFGTITRTVVLLE